MLSKGRVVADARGNIVDDDDPNQAFVVASRAGKPIPKQYEAAYKAYQVKQSPKNEPVTQVSTTPAAAPEPDPKPAKESEREGVPLRGGPSRK